MSATTEPEKAPDFAIPGVNQPLDKTKPRHMVTTIVHVSFKLVPLILYLFLYLFVDNFIMVFIIVTILVAMDFWATKNVTGRLMVGLRWWNEVKADGTSEWRFESQDPGLRNTNHIEMLAFWSCIILTPLLWLGFGILALIKINWDWLVLVCIAFVLTGANVVGYVKCAKDQRTGIKKAALSYATQQIITQGVNQMTQQV